MADQEHLQAPSNIVNLVSTEVLAPLTFIGGSGGTQHQVRGWEEGKRVTKLRVYSGPSQIKAIRLWLSGDEEGGYQQFGSPGSTDYEEFTFEAGERVTQMSLWGNGAGTRAGWIEFQTNKNKSFSYGMYSWGKKQEYEVNVGSGILVGAIYNAGDDIDAHGYYFLASSVASTQVQNVSYPTLTWDTQTITPKTLDTFNQTNTTSGPIAWKFAGKDTVTTSSSWTTSIDTTYEVNISVEASVPLVEKVGSSFGWSLSTSSSHQTSEEESHDVEWSNEGQLQPGESVSLVALTRKGELSVPYTGTSTVTLLNGASFSFPESGTYTGISFTGVEVS